MKALTHEEFCSKLDRDLAWRRRELTALRFAVESASESDASFMIRAAFVMLYAHWEGFTKSAAQLYLRYVAQRRVRCDSLSAAFVALAIRPYARRIASIEKPEEYIRECQRLLAALNGNAVIHWESEIITGSNLNFDRFRRILLGIGIDPNPFLTKQGLIDNRLVHTRNSVAHGNEFMPDFADYKELHDVLLELLAEVHDKIGQAVQQKAYQKSSIG